MKVTFSIYTADFSCDEIRRIIGSLRIASADLWNNCKFDDFAADEIALDLQLDENIVSRKYMNDETPSQVILTLAISTREDVTHLNRHLSSSTDDDWFDVTWS